VQNLSRDWVIDIITLTLNYDSDLEEVRKTIKRIGVELLDDPELGPNIIEPLKMQGIEQMADYGVQIRLKFMAKPGEQFGVRRKALAMLKKTFAEKGSSLQLRRFMFPAGRPMQQLPPPLRSYKDRQK